MSSLRKRVSVSSTRSGRSPSPLLPRFAVAPNDESEEWVKSWETTMARDLVDSAVVEVDHDMAVEGACELLLSRSVPCLVVKSSEPSESSPYSGLFDFADVNAFLTFAATRHTHTAEYMRDNPGVARILDAARAGHVPVGIVSNLSEKNPLLELPYDATVISLLGVFASGAHRVLLQALPLPSLNLYSEVVALRASDSVLDAMRTMSELGVSSVAVMDEETGGLLSAVSVTDVGRTVVPAQNKEILGMALQGLVAEIKLTDGSMDGADRYPVYSVSPTSSLSYTIQKLLATNSHRVFVTSESTHTPPSSGALNVRGNLTGIVSAVDILSLFARLANIPDVDPTRMQRHRRASSASSTSSSPMSGSFTDLGRRGSRSSIGARGVPGSM
ncbi:hypothetical protein OF83DRAFT_1212089 [Amylostereum chailletii]|nr:hypothetical protein OF83DRAFT_1212089 [Amylostereum chailletii]